MTKEQKKQSVDEAILADLQDPSLIYIAIALRHKVAVPRVCKLATAHNLNRKRGPKPRLTQEKE